MSSGRILVVDDEPQIRRVLRATLTGHGYEFYEARTGRKPWTPIRANRFDLVLLDMNMPGIGGLETCRAIRERLRVSIIMLTVRDSEHDKVAALDAGADDYVTKPFSTPELLARIRAALRRMPSSPEGGPQSVQLGRYRNQSGHRRVISHGREIRLTPKEFGLLQYLLANPNVPITAWTIAASGVGSRLWRPSGVSARIHESASQENRTGPRASAISCDGTVGRLPFRASQRRAIVGNLFIRRK